MSNLEKIYNKVLLNELYDNTSYSSNSIDEWYQGCIKYFYNTWLYDLNIKGENTDQCFNEVFTIIGYPNGLKDQTVKMFRQFYIDERMLGMLRDYQYISKDEHVYGLIEAELSQTCDWLIKLLKTCIQYHMLRELNETVQDVIAEYGERMADKILHSAEIKLQKINRLDPQICDTYLTGYGDILPRFIEDYKSGKLDVNSELRNKLIAVNEVKDFAHFNGSLLQGTDPFYIFSDDDTDLYDSLTQINERQIQHRLEKLIGYR